MRYLPHEAWGPKCFFHVVTKVRMILFKSARGWFSQHKYCLNVWKCLFVYTTCPCRSVCLVFVNILLLLGVLIDFCGILLFLIIENFFYNFFSEMGGKSEQGWVSNGNRIETRGNLKKLSVGKVLILTRSATCATLCTRFYMILPVWSLVNLVNRNALITVCGYEGWN